MSECAAARELLAPFLTGKLILEMGAGGDATVPHAITFDSIVPYTHVADVPQIMRGHCENLSMFCDGVADGIASHHLLEDFSYDHLVRIIGEWRRVLKPGGVLVTNCPDQQRFLRYIAEHNQGNNLAHLEQDFSLATFKANVLDKTGPWETVYEMPDDGRYSWYLVVKRA